MNKCEHGDKVTHFCVTDNCQYKEGAACELCLKKYHSHITHTIHLTQQQMQNLIKKFALDNTVKPKCRVLQESIYNYFNQIKSEISNSLDTVCKNIINQIGYPYLFSINGISTYKRLKNKEYRKITQKEFRAFYEAANKVQDADLIKQENKIYLQEIKGTNEAISKLQGIMKNYQQCIKRYHEDFTHDRGEQYNISQMVKSIGQQTIKTHKKNMESSLSKSKELQNFANPKDIKSLQTKNTQKNDNNQKVDNQRYPLTPSLLLPPKSQNREVSLDKRVIKQHKFTNNDKLVQQKTKQSQGSESNIGNKKIQNLKVELNNKQMQINEKKKLLIDIMKHNHTQKLQTIESLIKSQSIQTTPFKLKSVQLQNTIKKQMQSTEPKSLDESKSSMASQQNFIQEQNNKQDQVTNHAFTKLPIEQNVKKPELKHEVKKKMIVIPNLHIFKNINNNNKMDELDSPLYKKRRIQHNIEQIKSKQEALDKNHKNGEMQQKWVCRQMLQIKDNEEKSLALLLKSLTLSAEQAITYLQSSLKYADNNLSAAQYLSYLYLQTNRAKDCLVLCNKFIDKIESTNQPQQISINIINNKAAALNVLGRYSQAILILQNCLKHKEKDTLYKNLGDSYFSIGMHEKAIYNYQKSIKMNPSNDESHHNLAVCLYLQQNYQHSKFSIKKALELNPKQVRYLQLQSFIDGKIKSV